MSVHVIPHFRGPCHVRHSPVIKMIQRTWMLKASALLAFPIFALAADKPPNCDSPENGEELIACSAWRHRMADAKMNATYKQLRDVLRKRGEAEVEKRILQAQRDWLKFQNSHCEFQATYEGAGGSFVSAGWGNCMANTTTDRTKYLQDLLTHFK